MANLRRPRRLAGHPLASWSSGEISRALIVPGTLPTHCILTNRFKRGQRLGIRMTAIDGGSGEVENTAVLTAHLAYAGNTIDVPMRWRGVGGFPTAEYSRQPSEMWTGVWVVPADAPIGVMKLHGDGGGSIRPDRLVLAVHQRACRSSPSSNNRTGGAVARVESPSSMKTLAIVPVIAALVVGLSAQGEPPRPARTGLGLLPRLHRRVDARQPESGGRIAVFQQAPNRIDSRSSWRRTRPESQAQPGPARTEGPRRAGDLRSPRG